mgnify:CR=1 FL=1
MSKKRKEKTAVEFNGAMIGGSLKEEQRIALYIIGAISHILPLETRKVDGWSLAKTLNEAGAKQAFKGLSNLAPLAMWLRDATTAANGYTDALTLSPVKDGSTADMNTISEMGTIARTLRELILMFYHVPSDRQSIFIDKLYRAVNEARGSKKTETQELLEWLNTQEKVLDNKRVRDKLLSIMHSK